MSLLENTLSPTHDTDHWPRQYQSKHCGTVILAKDANGCHWENWKQLPTKLTSISAMIQQSSKGFESAEKENIP